MLLAVDVHYTAERARVAGVCFEAWDDDAAVHIYTTSIAVESNYQPGQFYLRELPGIISLLDCYHLQPDTAIIDGFVFLDGRTSAGLGKHLYDALEGRTSVVGVAKNRFRGISDEFGVLRGQSKRPLYVTSAGMSFQQAKNRVRSMHGEHRVPTLLKLADRVSRSGDSAKERGMTYDDASRQADYPPEFW